MNSYNRTMRHLGELAHFLRARRAAVTPSEAGLYPGDDRRVPGLRRGEVALLAGVSSDYYTKLEQGRERGPSDQVLEAISRALRLDPHLRRHLFDLAAPSRATLPQISTAEVSDELQILLTKFVDTAAMVVSPALDVLAANQAYDALYSTFDDNTNIAQMVFLDPASHQFYEDWGSVAHTTIQNLRALSAKFPDEQRVVEVVGTLAMRSPVFAKMWPKYELRPRMNETKIVNHPDVGVLNLKFQGFDIAVPGQYLWTYMAMPGTSSHARMRMLASQKPF
jgi:transcriptional regulator with XRE-family HTH domain